MNTLSISCRHAVTSMGQGLKRLIHKLFVEPSWSVKTCYLLIVVGILCYGYTWINSNFTVPLNGDYNMQEMTFLFNGYDDWHQFFKTGNFPQWDRSVFIGIDNIGGNSFYYLFDPFLLIMLPFPRSWLLQLQGLEFVLKMVLAGMFFYWYLGEFKLSPRVRMIGALTFGFSGYGFSYLWFHFIDSCAFLPLVFLGVERLIQRKDPRILCIAYFVNAMTSYFFFVVFMFGGFFYWCFRYLQDIFRRKKDENWAILGVSFIAFLVSVFLGLFTLLPGMVVATSMPRVTSATWLSNILDATTIQAKIKALLTYSYSFTQLTPLYNFLFMPNSCFSSNIMSVYWYDNFSASIYATTPMLLIFFVGLINSFRQKKISHIIGFLLTLVLVFTPIGFYLFSGFTVGYARYFIIPTAWLVAYDCITLEQRRKMPRSYLDLAFVMVMAIDIAACLLDIWFINTHSYTGWFNNSDWDNRIAEIPLSMLWCLVCYLILRPFFHKKQFHALFTGLCALDIIVMANVVISFWGTVDMTTYMGGTASVDEETQIVEMLKDSENGQDYYRIKNESQTPAYINLNLREGYEGLGAFHSVYAYAAQDFIDRSRLPYYYHDWEMSSENRRYNLETFLGTKYYLVKKQSTNFGANSVPKYDYDIPLGYVNVLNLTDEEKASLGVNYSDKLLDYLASSDCNRSLYVNLYYVDLGFSFDTVINEDWLYYPYGDNGDWNRYEDVNEYPLLRYAMLENSDYQDFYSAKKLNAGTFVANGVSYTQQASTSSNKLGLSNQFLTDLVTVSPYEEGKTAPIEHLTGASRLKATVYSAKRVATSESPVYGDYVYAVVDGKNIFYDDTMVFDSSSNTKVLIPTLAQWRKDNPLLEANGVYPADTKYDYYTHLDDDGKTVSNAGKVTYFSKVVYTPVTTTTDSLGKVTTTPTTVCAKADPSDPTSGCYLSIDDTNNITWRLYDKDNKPIASAKHPYCSYKHAHGYYTDRPVATIIGIVQSGSLADPTSLRAPSIYVERHSDYVAAVNTLKKYQPTITYRSDDRIDFSTTTEQDRFMVLNYPNAKGWKVVENITSTSGKTTQSEVKTYTADGGFIGFITLSGTHSYSLIYESPYFKLGGAVTALGALITLAFLAYYGMKDKEARMEDKGTLKTVLKAELQKEAWQQDDYEK
jgi:uncharacterized membrane protein YfhO